MTASRRFRKYDGPGRLEVALGYIGAGLALGAVLWAHIAPAEPPYNLGHSDAPTAAELVDGIEELLDRPMLSLAGVPKHEATP